MPTLTQIIADAYRKMVNPPQAVARPKWVPASVNEESVPAFVQAVTEARKANQSVVEFNGKKYGIKETTLDEASSGHTAGHFTGNQDSHAKNMATKFGVKTKFKYDSLTGNLSPHYTGKKSAVKAAVLHQYDGDHEMASSVHPHLFNEETNKEDDNKSKKIQDMDAENAPGDKRAEMAEELVGNQHKLDVNKNGKIDGDDLKKLRGEEKEEDSEEEHPEPDADNMGGPSDHDADNEDEDKKPKMTGEQTIASVAETYASMVNEDDYSGDNPIDKLHLDVPAFIRVLERAREDFKTDEDIHNFTQQLLAMKSDCIRTADLPSSPVKEGTAADAEAGPEVMDPVTQKAKDDADDETEIKDGVPGAAQDGGDKVSPADKPAAANSSAALPKVPVITAPVTTK